MSNSDGDEEQDEKMHLLFGNIMKIVIEIQFFSSDCICNLSTKVLEELDLLIIALAAQKDTQVRQRWEESFCSKIKKFRQNFFEFPFDTERFGKILHFSS